MANPSAISLGAGSLYIAPLGATEPTTLTGAWGDTWIGLGYTDDGSEFKYDLATENVEVAEELDPIRVVPTGRTISVAFALAEITATNLQRALNGGTITTGTGTVTFEPPVLGSESSTMLGWQSEDGEERWVFRKCRQTGSLTISRKKAPNKATMPVEFTLEKPDSGAQPFKVIFDDSRSGAVVAP